MRDAADRLESALGHEVRVKPKGGEIAVEIRFGDLEEARLALAVARLRIPAHVRAISSVG